MPSNVLVSGATMLLSMNGIYEIGPTFNGKNSYVLNDGVNIISFLYVNQSSAKWCITATQGNLGGDLFCALDDVEYPWLATVWYPEGDPDSIVVTEAPVPSDPVTLRNNKYATATEDGAHRFRRMLALGYV